MRTSASEKIWTVVPTGHNLWQCCRVFLSIQALTKDAYVDELSDVQMG